MEAVEQGKRGDTESGEVRAIPVKVNGTQVVFHKCAVTGLEIKEAAIKAGAPLELGFILQLEVRDGEARVVGDDETVTLRPHMCFTAIRPDDNS